MRVELLIKDTRSGTVERRVIIIKSANSIRIKATPGDNEVASDKRRLSSRVKWNLRGGNNRPETYVKSAPGRATFVDAPVRRQRARNGAEMDIPSQQIQFAYILPNLEAGKILMKIRVAGCRPAGVEARSSFIGIYRRGTLQI